MKNIFIEIFCDTPVETARQWNKVNERYEESMCETLRKETFCKVSRFSISFSALVQRYEAPDGKNRWDAPLFRINPDDSLPLEEIGDYFANKRPAPPNKSTINVPKIDRTKFSFSHRCFFFRLKLPISDTNLLHDIDQITQDVINVKKNPPSKFERISFLFQSIVEQSKMAMLGQELSICGTNEKVRDFLFVEFRNENEHLRFQFVWNKNHSLSELRRIRQQYLKFIKTHPPSKESTNMTSMFVQFLNNNLC